MCDLLLTVLAVLLGFVGAVGSELNAEYIEIAAKHRLAQGVLL